MTLPNQTYSSMKERFAMQWYSLPRWARITLVIGLVWAVWRWLNPWELIYLFLLIVGIGGSFVFAVFYVVFEFLGCGEDAVKIFSNFMEELKAKVAANAEAAANAAVNAVAEQPQPETPTNQEG